jgi:hypothetical protein
MLSGLSRKLAIAAVLVLIMAGCGGQAAPPAPSSTATQSPAQSEVAIASPDQTPASVPGVITAWTPDDQGPSASDDGQAVAPADDPGSDAVEVPAASVDPAADPYTPPTAPVDPCTLIDVTDWASVNDNGAVSEPVVLEGGDACGWTNGDDTRRLAVSLTDAGFAAGSGATGGEAVAGLGDSASWYADWPVSQSSTLVVTIGTKEFVLELSSQNPADADWMRASAISLARDAIDAGRLS